LRHLPLPVHRAIVELIRYPRSSSNLIKFTNEQLVDVHPVLRNAPGTHEARAQKARNLCFAALDRFHQALLSGFLVPPDENTPWAVVFYKMIQVLDPEDRDLLEHAYFGALFASLNSSMLSGNTSSFDKIEALSKIRQPKHNDDGYGPPPKAKFQSTADTKWVKALIWDVAIGIALNGAEDESIGALVARIRRLRAEAEEKLREKFPGEEFGSSDDMREDEDDADDR
jgi:hypothetical protein